MKISVVGTGYVGLVTGVCLAEIGHEVICIDTDINKVNKLKEGKSPIYEPDLEEMMIKNIEERRLSFTNVHEIGFDKTEVIFIAVGTPQLSDGSANLEYIESVAKQIAQKIKNDVIVVIKSTVPVGTNYRVQKIIQDNLVHNVKVFSASNPEFLREGSAVKDTFNGDRIVIGTDDHFTAEILEEMYKPLNLPIFKTDIASSEMIKYASNAFLATKISFINEISNICEKLGANVEDVANGMGYDKRIGRSFLNAGIGYGGSCFPKDTHALVQIAGGVEHDFELLKSVIKVNNNQQRLMVDKIVTRFGDLKGKVIGILGLAFKPNTDDMREAASIVLIKELMSRGAIVRAYDPISTKNAEKLLPMGVKYTFSLFEALKGADATVIVTEWDEFKQMNIGELPLIMNQPIMFDGRNCFSEQAVIDAGIEYHSVGRKSVYPSNSLINS
ncbi:UDP-glucose dehydrogenase family protein [Priestia aryabhattai]|uniref:UDP-glucose dehydrogenase family protein n=1 Tax=Priestia aryabhattai TaxID=412384 RepID=UPI000BFE39A8|nr:UDP-glucose/GDP-mannose dehydrogenase family protein [Priestia aryabhattai]PHF78028.1 UDP-glucose 6-dehydrogenase [Priestia aryabhattai]